MTQVSFDVPWNKVYKGNSPSRNAKIRFLPSIPREEETDTQNKRHYNVVSKKYYKIQGIGGFYQENSLLDLGQPDPVYEYVDALYNKAEAEGDQELLHVIRSPYPYSNDPDFRPKYRSFKPKGLKPMSSYITNIYVIEDEECPSCNGKVFLYRYGKSIQNICRAFQKAHPTVSIFNPYRSPVFVLSSQKVGHNAYNDYSGSHFDMEAGPIRLADTDDRIEEILAQRRDLSVIIQEHDYKPYDVLKKRFIDCLSEDYYNLLGIPVPESSPIYHKPSIASARRIANAAY